MSFKRNVLASYIGQIYVTLIAIVMVPMYVRYMGAEAYGLVGFFAMLQAWFMLLDMGLTPTMARETARFNGGATDALSLRRLLRAMEGIFILVAAVGSALLVAGSGAIAGSWLKVQHLPISEVQNAIMMMAAIVALRWVCGLYRGAINGLERLVWLSGFNIAIATARFVLVIPFFKYIGTSPTHFFAYQLLLAVIELTVLAAQTYRLLPKVANGPLTPWQWSPLKGVLKFSLTIAVTGSIWVLVTQTDKLVLSSLLPLSEYAYFTLAVLVATGVTVVSGPVSSALLPRMSKLAASGDEANLVRSYRNASQLVAIIAIPAALMLAFFPRDILWAWTGDDVISYKAAPVLTLYALGNGILALSAFPYYLQFSKGNLRLHLIGNGLFVVFLIPALIWATLQFGIVGAGWAWLGANVAYFLVWVPIIHRELVPGLHLQWLKQDLAPIVLVALSGATGAKLLLRWPQDRVQLAVSIGLVGAALISMAICASTMARRAIKTQWRVRGVGLEK